MGRQRKLYLPSRRIVKHVPTKVSKLKVRTWAEVGTARQIIANELGISVPTLNLHYGVELAEAEERGVARVAESLYAKALKGDVTAMTFFLKTRGRKLGWAEDKGDNGQTTNILQLNLVKSITAAVSQMRQQGGEAAQMLIEHDEVVAEVVEPIAGTVDFETVDEFDLVGSRS